MTRGRRPLPWIKLWFDIIGDPKMAQLSAAEKWCWVGILLLAGQSPIRGKLMLSESKPMSQKDIAKALRLSPKEQKALNQCITKMTDTDSLERNNDCLEVIHFRDRQEVFESDLIDYHKKKGAELTPDKFLKTPELTPDLLQKEGEGRGEKEKKDITPKGASQKQADPVIDEIFAEMRSYLGYPDRVERDPIPSYGKEGSAIKRMLARGFTREEVTDCWKQKVDVRGGEFVSMTWVNEDIGKKGVKAREQRGKGVRPKPDQRRVHPIKRIPGN